MDALSSHLEVFLLVLLALVAVPLLAAGTKGGRLLVSRCASGIARKVRRPRKTDQA
ncbi:MAG: hypothetical protein HY720_18210 [Planctomycetes bacterium]|nr:hypothetical protein [Planctomycetota bacterium]